VPAKPKKTEDLRARVLEASVALIAAEGLSALSFREVARRAGVSHQAPYHHFADREAILAAIAEEGFKRLADGLEAAAKKKTAHERFDAGGRAYVQFAASSPAHFRIMFRPELCDVSKYPSADAEAKRAYAALESLVAELVEDGVVPQKRAPGATLMAWSFVHGLASLYVDGPLTKTGPQTVTPEQQLEAAFSAFQAMFWGEKKPKKRRSRSRG
jgi:AcrR family transcriptional regulator